jgi:nicotinamide phosphoribosyltransferase
MHDNIIMMTDSYKVSHHKQYPPGTQHVFSYFESRGGVFDRTVFFGLQYILRRYLTGSLVNHGTIHEAKTRFHKHFGSSAYFNETGWLHIAGRYGGYLPLEIRALPEGTVAPTGTPLITVVNTDPAVPWLTNYVETILSQVWYPTTVCTQSHAMRKIILDALKQSGTPETIDFRLHDFGYRGSTSVESAAIGGLAHLVNFKGTDTFAAIELGEKYYGEPMAGFSVPAAEHSTITSWGRDYEIDAYHNMLDQYPTGTVAVVSDSYNIYEACRVLWGGELRDRVLERDGCLVIRPDSGDPKVVLPTVSNLLYSAFGGMVNAKGFTVLNPKVRLIQGDGIDYATLGHLINHYMALGWSADNLSFGSGGGLLQKVNRDTCKFAFKCSSAKIDGVWRPVSKDPVTDSGKRSKEGILDVDDGFTLMRLDEPVYESDRKGLPRTRSLMETVYYNGDVCDISTLAEIRERARQHE